MSRLVKCPECGKSNNKEDTIEINKRYYCIKCGKDKQKSSNDYKNLIEYICSLYNIDSLPPIIYTQIKQYKENPDYKFTYKGIELTLKYYYEVLKNIPSEDKITLGIVPYYYEKAKNNYIEELKRKKSTKKFLDKETFFTYIPININHKRQSNTSAKRKYINIESISENEDD